MVGPILKRGIVLGAVLAALVFTGAAAPSLPPAPPADEATAYQLDAAHDGAIADAGLTTPLAQAWSIAMPGASYPLIADGMVFVASSNNTLNALDQATGATIWSHPVVQPAALAYDRGQVFMVNRGGLLDAFNAATGVLDSTVQLTGQPAFGTLTVGDGNLYVIGQNSFKDPITSLTLYAVRESDGHVLWNYTTFGTANSPSVELLQSIVGSPSVTPTGVYVSTTSFDLKTQIGCKETYDFDPQSGATVWHASECQTEAISPAIAASGHVLNGDMLYSPATGAVQGRLTGGPFGFTPIFNYLPAIANDVLYEMPPGGPLNAVAGTGLGAIKWTLNGVGGITASPIVAGGTVFVASTPGNPPSTGTISAVDAATGAITWSTSLGSVPKALAASNGTLVVTAGDTLTAYSSAGAITAVPANHAPPTVEGSADLNDIKGADVGVWSGLPSGYTYQWERCDSGGANCADIVAATAPSYLPGADLYGETLRVKVAATNGIGSSASVESAASPVLGLSSVAPALSTAPVVIGDATVGQQLSTTNGTWTGSATSYAYKWQRCDGSGANCVDIPGATSSQYSVVVADKGKRLRSEVWASNAAGQATGGYAPSGITSRVSNGTPLPVDQATSYGLDPAHDSSIPNAGLTGQLTQAWSHTLPGKFQQGTTLVSSSLIADGTVFVEAGNSIYALNQATGATVWSHPMGGAGAMAYDHGRLFSCAGGTYSGWLTAFDAATGSIDWTVQPPGYTGCGTPVAANGIVYLLAGNPGVAAYAIRETDGTALWSQTLLGDGAGPPAVTQQGVYFTGTYDFDPLLGTMLWHQPVGDTSIVASGHVVVGGTSLSPSNGDVQGPVKTGTADFPFRSYQPAVANGVEYLVSAKYGYTSWPNSLSAFANSGLGDHQWTFGSDQEISTAPLVADGRVFFGTGNDKLYALDAATGATSWSASVGYMPQYLVAANGTLVVASGNQLFAYSPAAASSDVPANVAPPSVDGDDDLNELNVTDVGVWSGLPSSYAYQWELCDASGANCADIAGATASTYTPGAEAYGQTIRVRVTATNGIGSSAPVESTASDVLGLAAAAPGFSTAPAVVGTGTPTVGQQLSTTNGTWTNSATSYAYQWQRCDDTGQNCADIPGATASTYTPVPDDVGSTLRSEVLAGNSVGQSPNGYAPSPASDIVAQLGTPTIPPPPADEATAYQLDGAHDGSLADAGLTAPLAKQWSVTFPTAVSDSVIADGMVYVTSQLTSQIIFQNRPVTAYQNVLYALNQATGATVWMQPLGAADRQVSSPGGVAYDRGRVFVVGEQDISAGTRAKLFAFDAATGQLAWSVVPFANLFVGIGGQPIATHGIVYVEGGPSGVDAVRESDGSVIWPVQTSPDFTPPSGIGGSEPSVSAQGVYLSNDIGSQAWGIDPLVGELQWHEGQFDGGGHEPAPVTAGGHVYVLGGQNLILSASTGAAQGSFNGGTSPAVANGVLYSIDGSVLSAVAGFGLGNSGWTFTPDGGLSTAPIVAGGLVFVGSSQGNLYAVDVATGAQEWTANIGASSADPPSLSASNGTLVVSIGKNLIAYGNSAAITDPPANEETPSVEGPADLSGLMGADVGVWSGLPSAYSYQWELCDSLGENCADIAGATGASYLPPAGDVGVGATLRVRVTATNGIGSSAPVESSPSERSPLVVGTQQALRRRGSAMRATADPGQQIATTDGIWTNDPASYTYKWQRCNADGHQCVTIAGATSPHYTPVSTDAGYIIRSEVRASNAVGRAATFAPSATSTLISGGQVPRLLKAPVISGSAVVGGKLTTDKGQWTHTPLGYLYRWQRCDTTGANCVNITNATTSHYTVVQADTGHKIRSEVDAVNNAGVSPDGYQPSAPTGVVGGKPAVITLPKVSGVAIVGNSLSVTTGTWKYSPTHYAYQWLRCSSLGTLCTKIVGATSSSYLLKSADVGHKLKARVTASNAAGSVTATTSNASATVVK